MVVSKGRRMVRSGVSLRGLARVLRQHRHNEGDDCVVCSLEVLRLDFRRDVRSAAVSCLETQSFHLPDAIRSVGPVFHLPALRRCQSTRSVAKILFLGQTNSLLFCLQVARADSGQGTNPMLVHSPLSEACMLDFGQE